MQIFTSLLVVFSLSCPVHFRAPWQPTWMKKNAENSSTTQKTIMRISQIPKIANCLLNLHSNCPPGTMDGNLPHYSWASLQSSSLSYLPSMPWHRTPAPEAPTQQGSAQSLTAQNLTFPWNSTALAQPSTGIPTGHFLVWRGNLARRHMLVGILRLQTGLGITWLQGDISFLTTKRSISLTVMSYLILI